MVYMCSNLVGAAAIITSLREKSHTYSVVVDKDGRLCAVQMTLKKLTL